MQLTPTLQVAYLIDDHGDTLSECPGCDICKRIAKLKTQIDPDPSVKYRHILDKGQDMTKSDIKYLLNKGVYSGTIRKATGMKKTAFVKMMEDLELLKFRRNKERKPVGKFNLTQAEYKDHKAQGKSDEDIAKAIGVSTATLAYHKKKWSQEIKPRTPKLILAEGESSPSVHEDLVHDLSSKLRKAEKQNDLLEKKVAELEEQIKNLHAAAEDTEKEVAASIEYIEREQELMTDANVWKHQAELYKNENDRLNETLSEVREELKKSKGENLLFRAVIKEVII